MNNYELQCILFFKDENYYNLAGVQNAISNIVKINLKNSNYNINFEKGNIPICNIIITDKNNFLVEKEIKKIIYECNSIFTNINRTILIIDNYNLYVYDKNLKKSHINYFDSEKMNFTFNKDTLIQHRWNSKVVVSNDCNMFQNLEEQISSKMLMETIVNNKIPKNITM